MAIQGQSGSWKQVPNFVHIIAMSVIVTLGTASFGDQFARILLLQPFPLLEELVQAPPRDPTIGVGCFLPETRVWRAALTAGS